MVCLVSISDQNMMIPNGTLNTTYHLSQFNESLARCASCQDTPAYLRPDVAGSLLPWLYTLLMIIIHLPTVIIRVVQWEKVQFLVLCLGFSNVLITLQGYVSTQLRAEDVLVWMPLTVPLDAGAVIQVMVLLFEHDANLRGRLQRWWTKVKAWPGGLLGPKFQKIRKDEKEEEDLERPKDMTRADSRISMNDESDEIKATVDTAAEPAPLPFPFKSAFIMTTAFLIFLSLLIIQFIAIRAASTGKLEPALKVSWCSPIFQPYGLSVLDGNGNTHPIVSKSEKGIGCILLDALEQRHWLTATLVLVSVSVVLELGDLLFLIRMSSESKFNGVRLRRPWLTMFYGMGILVVLTCFAVFQSSALPSDITSSVWVFRHDLSMDRMGACQGKLKAAGLRGAILAWTDGLLSSWGTTYYG